jgi:hypothetical protein
MRLKTLLATLLFIPLLSFANNDDSIEIFSSNNTEEISLETAFNRLAGTDQQALRSSITQFLQQHHVEQGEVHNLLGAYQMQSDKKITGDNTESFYTSPLQHFSKKKIFLLAAELSQRLRQESVAVFIPESHLATATGDVILVFRSDKPTITTILHEIQEKLPASYNTAFSLHLINVKQGYKQARVAEIEWLGSKINPDIIRNTFPNERVIFHEGTAYLVFKDGKVQQL